MRVASALLLCLAGSLVFAQEEPPRLRTLVPNGSILLVENMPAAKSVSVQLFASSRRVPDTPENHGYKHLLEHLVLKGHGKDLDLRMERQGIFFSGHTLRDAMQIVFTCLPEQIPTVLDALTEILQPLATTHEDIVKEVKIMREERALEDDSERLSAAAWNTAFGDRGMDPFGDPSLMEGAAPEDLVMFQSKLFAANNLVLVISGPVDIEKVTSLGKSFLAGCSGNCLDQSETRPEGEPGRTNLENAFGEARGARVPGIDDAKAAWGLAAALALASQLGDAFVTYTPSAQNALVIVGKTDENSGVGLKVDALTESDIAAMFPIGKALARRWLQRQMETPAGSANIRGLLLCEGASYKPEEMLDNINAMTWQQFAEGIALFKEKQADIVVGTR